jgi:CIC family chloride channel protein
MFLKNSISGKKLWLLCLSASVLGVLATFVAKLLLAGIAFFTNLFYLHKVSLHEVHITQIPQTTFLIFIPVIGGILVGLIARYGSAGIRGHGIPEAMEKILYGDSRIPRRITFLKPFASALAIGTGGPFGAEGPIIATGASLGSWLGRHGIFNSRDRKILLSAGAAAGMTAIFGTPLSAVFISIELLLFEFSASTFVPVVVAVAVAYIIRMASGLTQPVFAMDMLEATYGYNMIYYFIIGAMVGGISCIVSKMVFWIEEQFEKLPIHWMYWPAIGGIAVGLIGFIDPRSLGVGYENITNALHAKLLIGSALALFFWKFLSWVIALGSGTSGGTLAPLLTFGSSLGLALGLIGQSLFPELGIRPEICALVGMSAMFAGATRAILTSTVFALESTGVSFGVAPLLLGNSAAYLISLLCMEETIMTERLSRHGKHVPSEYFHVKSGNEFKDH